MKCRLFIMIAISIAPSVAFELPAHAATHVAEIVDPDGFTHLRLRPGLDAPTVGKIIRGQKILVSTSQRMDNPDWFPAVLGENQFGFVHKSRVRLGRKVDDALILVGRSLVQLMKSGVEAPVGAFFSVKSFDRLAHKLTMNSKGGVELIDGHTPFGVDGNVPKIKFNHFKVFFAGSKIAIDPKWYQDCYDATLDEDKFRMTVSQSGKEILLSLTASDGAGRYSATWIMEENGKIARMVAYP